MILPLRYLSGSLLPYYAVFPYIHTAELSAFRLQRLREADIICRI